MNVKRPGCDCRALTRSRGQADAIAYPSGGRLTNAKPDKALDCLLPFLMATARPWEHVDRMFATSPDSPGQCEPGLSDDRPRDPRLCYCPELSPRATRSSSS